MAYQIKKYRSKIKTDDLVSFQVSVKETDLFIRAETDLADIATNQVLRYRKFLEDYIKYDSEFLETMEPYENVPSAAPNIIIEMIKAGNYVNVGPMAAVAGAISEYVGTKLLEFSDQVIVENGGDIFIKTEKPRLIGLYAGSSPFTHKVALQISPESTPMGVCTSSGTVGHSRSFGKTDAVVVTAKSTLYADAAATAIGNLVQSPHDFEKAVDFAKNHPLLDGVVIIKDDKMTIWGDIQLEKIN